MQRILLVILALSLTGCEKKDTSEMEVSGKPVSEYEPFYHSSLKESFIEMPLDYPVDALQTMINRILPDTLVNDTLKLNGKGDYVLLKVVPMGKVAFNGYQNMLDASMPLNAIIYFKKKVGAFNISNRKPAKLKLRVDLHTILGLDQNFNLSTTCSIQKIQWIDEPVVRVAGIKVNLTKKITKQLQKNKEIMAQAICKAINQAVPLKEEVNAFWELLNTPHRVASTPVPIWMSVVPKSFSAQFDKTITDTLRVNIKAQTGVLITPLKGMDVQKVNLPENQVFKSEAGLNLVVSVNVPYEYLNLIISSQLDSVEVEYAGLATRINNFKTFKVDDQLKLQFQTVGDVDAVLEVTAKPSLTSSKELVFDNLTYAVSSDNLLVNTLDWFSNSSIDTYIRESTKIPLAYLLDSLDTKIVKALERKDISTKIDLDLNFSQVESDTILYYQDRFEWLFSVKGEAHAYLSDSLVVRSW
ncbi:MAG: DUF4403 family protein [Bacteroidota bacterium]